MAEENRGSTGPIPGQEDAVSERTWESSEPLPEQKRWKMSFRDEKSFAEAESDSLRSVIRAMWWMWSRRKRSRWAKIQDKWYVNKPF
jgi:hypothetical protein